MKAWIRERADGIIPVLVLAAFMWLVAVGAPLVWLWWGAAALIVALLQCNPLGAFDGVLPVETRTLLMASVVCWFAASLPLDQAAKLAKLSANTLGVRIITASVGVVLAVVAIRQRAARLEEWRKAVELEEETERIIQAPQVDKVLGQLNAQRNANASHPWNPSEAATAWSEFGFGQVRALLHQGLDDEQHRTMCTDGLISIFCYPVWLLAWVHALKWVEKLKAKHKDELNQKDEKIERLKSSVERLQNENGEQVRNLEGQVSGFSLAVQATNKDVQRLRQQLNAERQKVEELQAELEAMRAKEAEPDEPPVLEIVQPKLTGQALEDEMLRLNESGVGYGKLGEMFGVAKSTAQKAVNRAKARREVAV